MFYAYVLKSQSTNKRYIGQTSDIKQRISAHNNGDSRYTKNRGPWVLIYHEGFRTRSEALIREKFLKSGKGREFLQNIGK
jgi:putative endonuclease